MHQASIFLVDDHPLVRRGLSQLIDGEPEFSVCGEAATAQEARKLLSKITPDLAIIDLSLPDGNGMRLIKHLLAVNPELTILISSMHDESMYAERVLKAGARGYISKSATGDEVIAAIKKVLNGNKYVSRKVSQLLSRKDSRPQQATDLSPVQQLSNRELEVFEYIGRGLGTGDIASKLKLSIKTVESHRANIKRKLELDTAGELVRSAIQWSLEEANQLDDS